LLASRRLRVLISPIYVSDRNTPADMRIGSAFSVYAKALLVIMSMVIAAFKTSIYGASLKRFLTISFHIDDVGRMTLGHQSSDAIRMMVTASKVAV
jgi:hypothetical protein